MDTYANGMPTVGWCIECGRPVALMAAGILVPHRKKKGRGTCLSDWRPIDSATSLELPGGEK